jgi:hypothetical protein
MINTQPGRKGNVDSWDYTCHKGFGQENRVMGVSVVSFNPYECTPPTPPVVRFDQRREMVLSVCVAFAGVVCYGNVRGPKPNFFTSRIISDQSLYVNRQCSIKTQQNKNEPRDCGALSHHCLSFGYPMVPPYLSRYLP